MNVSFPTRLTAVTATPHWRFTVRLRIWRCSPWQLPACSAASTMKHTSPRLSVSPAAFNLSILQGQNPLSCPCWCKHCSHYPMAFSVLPNAVGFREPPTGSSTGEVRRLSLDLTQTPCLRGHTRRPFPSQRWMPPTGSRPELTMEGWREP